MNALKKVQLRTTSLILAFAVVVSCLYTTGGLNAYCATVDSGYDSGHPAPIVYDTGKPEQVTMHKTVDSGTDRVFDIHLGVEAKKQIISEKIPCDIVLVLDRSGSMADPMDAGKLTLIGTSSSALDKNKTYYVKESRGRDYYLTKYDFSAKEWVYFAYGPWYSVSSLNRPQFYDATSKIGSLKSAAKIFAEQVAESSPDSRIGIIDFGSDTAFTAERQGMHLLRAGNEKSLQAMQKGIDTMRLGGATMANDALVRAQDLLREQSSWEKVSQEENRRKIVVFFTDGQPNYGNGFDPAAAREAEQQADNLRSEFDAVVYSIGVFGDLTGTALEQVTEFMNNVASYDENTDEKLYYPVGSAGTIGDAFDKVQETVGGLAGVQVRDYIDSRFSLVLSTLPKGATAHKDEHGEYVSWSGLTIDNDHLFSKTFQVRAKNSTGGKDYIPTNQAEFSGVYSDGELKYQFPEPRVKIDKVPATAGLTATKTSKLKDWDTRKYQIDLTATAQSETEETECEPCDIVMVLDCSGSMRYHMYSPENNPDPSESYFIYRSTATADDGPYQLVKYYKKGWYLYNGYNRYHDRDGWYYDDTNNNVMVTPTVDGDGKNNNYQFYNQESQTRMEALKSAANTFVGNVKKKSADSRIAVVSYANQNDTKNLTQGLVSVSDTDSDKIGAAIDSLNAVGSTYSNEGLEEARNIFDTDEDAADNKRMVILFTDGEPGPNGFDNYKGYITAAATIDQAEILKGEKGREVTSQVFFNACHSNFVASGSGCGATVYTVGVFSGVTGGRKELDDECMSRIASYKEGSETEKLYYAASNTAALNDIFTIISQEVGSISNAVITDVLDPRFDLCDANGNVLSRTGTHAVNGAQASYDDDQDCWRITWSGASIGVGTWADNKMTAPGWQKSIQIQAKDEFIGGNDIPTNIASESKIKIEDDFKLFGKESPTVNVKPIFYAGNDDKILFRGETVPDAQIDSYKIAGKDPFCGQEETGTFRYQWYKAAWENNAWVQKESLGAASDSPAFPSAITPDDSAAYMLAVTFSPSSSGAASKPNCTDPAHPNGRAAGSTLNTMNPINKTAPNGIYTVNVVKGQLQITKTVNDKYPAPAGVKAKQSFVFRVERRNQPDDPKAAETFYEVVTLSDNTLTANKTMTGLKKGFYKVTEETGDAWRYTLDSVQNNDTDSQKNKGMLYIGREETPGPSAQKAYFGAAPNSYGVPEKQATIAFLNHLTNGKWLGDTTVKVNTVHPAG
ncbi:vWA domain-containing protein [Caproiciproducens galactitolivorans]|uniref:VWA domain-containing protein n=1 Tax=Caproiciproducens galactitolivorans TaxID=642589 RepID=A0ABT4BVM6_9FIRM|nr:vWA domain-containing protein [Caproiciproducens galactitolivorans]MCY1714128.1 VWA domain-containing protein [Caproiciproducens galactitolivorans]